MNRAMSQLKTTLVLACVLNTAVAHEQTAIVTPEIIQSLRAAFSSTRIDHIAPSEFSGLYELHMGKNVAYSSREGRYLLVGHIYDTASGEDITQRRVDAYAPTVSFASLPLDAAVRHGTPGGVKVAVFTDPDCPYCRKLSAMMPQITGVEWYEMLMPLETLHPQAPAKARDILCHADRLGALRAAMQGQGLSQATEACDAQSLLQSISEVATQLGIVGTPTLIREDGVILKGVTNLDALQSWVGAVSPVSPVAPTVTANQEIQP